MTNKNGVRKTNANAPDRGSEKEQNVLSDPPASLTPAKQADLSAKPTKPRAAISKNATLIKKSAIAAKSKKAVKAAQTPIAAKLAKKPKPPIVPSKPHKKKPKKPVLNAQGVAREKPRSARYIARALAAQILYALDMGSDLAQAKAIAEESPIAQKYKDFATDLCDRAIARLAEIDALIAQRLTAEWTMERLGRVEKAILRLAIAEFGAAQTDAPIVINEAVELAKEFIGNDAASLINGILESVRKTAR
ncbi:MAG: transcription antitermination factor NusB [Helicobacteraceae bacterium]|jgi:N utilization substance protein B|nr:transcription antitermination factor NusB [Helicobacteraceae bacterium]